MSEEKVELQPPVVYLPCRLDAEGELEDIRMVRLADGRVALLGYTALDRFIACCGDAHPWALHLTADLERLRAEKPYDAAYLDVPLPPELRLTSDPEGARG